MATRKPLVIDGSKLKELTTGDTLDLVGSSLSLNTVSANSVSVDSNSANELILYDSDNTVIKRIQGVTQN